MNSFHLQSAVEGNRKQPLVSIHWDYQNIPDGKIAESLLKFASLRGYVVTRKAYHNWGDTNKDKKVLADLDFTCINVSSSIKNAVDFKLVIDCTSECSSYLSPDIVIVVSGDCYSEILLNELHPKRKKVIILARKGSEYKNLRSLADEFYYVDELPKLLNSNTQHQTTSGSSYINYERAIDYMIEAIKTASKQGKPTAFGYIDNLMRQLFPNYKGVSSIRKKDGTKFGKFSKFVDAAIDEGKVCRQNEEIFLIEQNQLAI